MIQVPTIILIVYLLILWIYTLYLPSFLWHCNTFVVVNPVVAANFLIVFEINFRQAPHEFIPNFRD